MLKSHHIIVDLSVYTSNSVVVQSLSRVWFFVTHGLQHFTVSLSLLKLVSTESVMPSNHPIVCCPLLLLPSIFPSIRIFSNESALCISWLKYGASASASVLPMNIQGWFPLGLTVLISFLSKCLLQHRSSKASIPWCSAFFVVQLSHPYMTTGKTIALTIQTFVGKVMSLLFNTLSWFIIAILPKSKCLIFMAAVTICSDFEAQENKICHCFHFFPIYLPWRDGTGCPWMLSFKPAFSLSTNYNLNQFLLILTC